MMKLYKITAADAETRARPSHLKGERPTLFNLESHDQTATRPLTVTARQELQVGLVWRAPCCVPDKRPMP
jgi:hypothetical protein